MNRSNVQICGVLCGVVLLERACCPLMHDTPPKHFVACFGLFCVEERMSSPKSSTGLGVWRFLHRARCCRAFYFVGGLPVSTRECWYSSSVRWRLRVIVVFLSGWEGCCIHLQSFEVVAIAFRLQNEQVAFCFIDTDQPFHGLLLLAD